MNKRKICKIVKYSTLATTFTSITIGMLPSIINEVNVPAAVIGTSIGTAAGVASIISNNKLYRYNKRIELLENKKNSETYKRGLLKDIEKMDAFGMYVINKTSKLDYDTRDEVFNDFDIDMEILEDYLKLLESKDEEDIDDLYERIYYLQSFVKSDVYTELKDKFYKTKTASVIDFKTNNEEKPKGSKLLQLKKNKKKTINDDKE